MTTTPATSTTSRSRLALWRWYAPVAVLAVVPFTARPPWFVAPPMLRLDRRLQVDGAELSGDG